MTATGAEVDDGRLVAGARLACHDRGVQSSGHGLVSEADFLALPESHDRLELIEGEIILGRSPTPVHQLIVARLCRFVGTWVDANPPAFLGLSPLDVRLSPGRIVQPDLFVLLGGLPSFEGPIDAVPELVIEVLSRDRGYDRVTKRVIYAQAGVSEYWIVDPLQRRVEVCQGLDHVDVFTDMAVSRVAKELRVEIDAVFPR